MKRGHGNSPPVGSAGKNDDAGTITAPTQRVVGSSLLWSAGNQIFLRAANLATTIVIAHIVGPKQYGLYAVALAAMAILLSVNDGGVVPAILRYPGDISRMVPTATSLSVGLSALFTAGAWAVAPLYTHAVHASGATFAVRIVSLLLLVDGIAGVSGAMLARHFAQRQRFLADIVGFVASTAVTLVLAVKGYGVEALAWGVLVGGIGSAATTIALAPSRLQLGFDAAAAKSLSSLGWSLSGNSLLTAALTNIDYVIVGRLSGPVALGFYSLAFGISNWPVNVISVALQRVTIPALSAFLHEPLRFAQAYRRAFDLVLYAVMACVLPVAAAAPQLIRLVYGRPWEPAAPVLEVLMFLGALRVLLTLVQDALTAAGRGLRLLASQSLWLVGIVLVLPIAVKTHGIAGAGIGHVVIAGLVILPVSAALAASVTGMSVTTVVASVAKSALLAAPAFAAGLLVRGRFHSPVTDVACVTFVTLAVYAAVRPLPLLMATRQLRQLTRREA